MQWIIGGILVIGFFVLLEFRSTKKSDSGHLIVGVMSGYPPYAQFDEGGNLIGFDIDVANKIAQKLNKELELKDMSLGALLTALQQNKVDLILSGLCITTERKKKLSMIYYQGKPTTTYPLVFWQKIPESIKALEDLKNYPNAVVCVEPGSSQERFLLTCDFLTLRHISNPIDLVMDLKYGKSLAALFDPTVLPLFAQKNPELKVLEVPLPLEYQSEGCGIAINKNNDELSAKIELIINELKKDGTLDSLEQKWFRIGE